MKLYTGVDLVDVERISALMQKPRFLQEFFSKEERALFARQQPMSAQRVAGNFAAKEAFAKAVGTGVSGFSLAEVSALRDAAGRPYYQLHGRAAALYGALQWQLSISHTATAAIAFAIALSTEEGETGCSQ